MKPVDIESENFLYHHHVLRCKSSDPDPFLQASCRRKSVAQLFYASHSLCDASGVTQILRKQMNSYHALVDDRAEKSVNNYADGALHVASIGTKNDSTKWKSGLRSNRPVAAIRQKLMECPGQCSYFEVLEQDLKTQANAPTSDKHKETNQRVGNFVPKIAGPSKLQREQSQRETSANIFQQSRAGSAPLFRGSSFDSTSDVEGGNNSTFWQGHHTKSVGHGSGGPVHIGSNEYDKDSFGRKSSVQSSMLNRNLNNFGSRVDGNHISNVQVPGAGPQCGGVNNRFMVGGNEGIPTQTMGNSFGRGASSNNFGSGFNRNVTQNGQKNNQNTQAESGMSSVQARIFKTARDELTIQNQKKYGSRGGGNNGYAMGRGAVGGQKRSLGTRRAGVHGQFVPPIKPTDEDDFGGMFGVKQPTMEGEVEEEIDERLKNIDPKMIETIRNEIMDIGAPVEWDDIAGLDFAKKTIQEIVVWPLLRPDIFTGLRKPPKGLLLFGPPGTGKTLIGKCIASQSQSTFFSISASSLTSKWIGDGEKMVRALFAVAKVHQPSVVFIDEIDSLLTQRSDTEHESSRRIKTEFLVQLDGAGTGDEERILVVGATNRPQELDEAARRRLVKRLYIPLPEFLARKQIVERLMSKERSVLTAKEIDDIASLTDGYSGADMKNLCQEASLGPIRSISFSAMHQITADQVRPIALDDFKAALQRVRASVSNKDLDAYVQWDKTYGMGSGM